MFARTLVTLALFSWAARAELPVARLQSVFPPGGQAGTSLDVKVEGPDLDDATRLHFSVSGISSEHKPTNAAGVWSVTISSNVPPGLYEARVLGRFGLSNPRFFTVGPREERMGGSENRSLAAALAVPSECTVNAVATASAADFYKFEAKKDQRFFIRCQGEPFDSKMRASVLLYDAAGNELARDRRDGSLDFRAPQTGMYVLKVHDQQFRGGGQFAYRLTVTTQPQVDYIFPAARTSGNDRRFTLFGRGFPDGDERPLEINVPKAEEAFNLLNTSRPRRLADCALTSFDLRLPGQSPWEISIATAPAVLELEPNSGPGTAQMVTVPCEIQGQFYPQGDVDYYQFTAKKGEVFWIEAYSERLGLPTDPFVLVQTVATNAAGESVVSDVQEMYDSEANLGGPLFNTSSRDPSWRLEVKEESTYRVQIRDLFNRRSDPARLYRLAIRRETPDFRLIALIAPPAPFDKEKREAQVWSSLLRRNDTLAIKVIALRRDNFNGEIRLQAAGLPSEVTASESIIGEGQNFGWLTLSAGDKAPDWFGAMQILGQAKAGGTELTRRAQAATAVWDVPDFNNESVKSRLIQETMLALSSEAVPWRISCTNSAWQVAQTAALSIPLQITRSPDFKEPVKLRAYLDAQTEVLKEWDVDGQAGQTSLELDLKQMKIATGAHQFLVLAQTKGKIRRIRPEEVPALEAAEKAAKDDAEKKRLQERLRLHEVSGIFTLPVVKLLVNPAPTAAK